jgi:hypothetical protein
MQFKSQRPAEALGLPDYLLDSREDAIFEAPVGGPRNWIEGSSFGADTDPAPAELKGSPGEGSTRDGGRERPRSTRLSSSPSTWRRLAAAAVPRLAAYLIEGFALCAAAEYPELLLPLSDYWCQDNAAERRARTGRTGFAGWHDWITSGD